jgi:predicted polyphosphate/ATP-dependent NAD kinase
MVMKIAFMVNPLAGLGTLTNEKGSDHLVLEDCMNSVSMPVAEKFITMIKGFNIHFITAGGCMGGDIFSKLSIGDAEIMPGPSGTSRRADTIQFIERINYMNPDMVVFVGGDGTARDISSVLKRGIPLMGIPAGVKMYSSVFALSVQHGSDLIKNICEQNSINSRPGEIVDIDESDYRNGKLNLRIFGTVLIPESPEIIGIGKAEYSNGDLEGIVDYIVEKMDPETTYIIGPGSTCKAISRHFGIFTNDLGFDIMKGGKLIIEDADSNTILKAAENGKTIMILSPIGGQGFLMGRGNRQINADVMDQIGLNNLVVISAPEKIEGISKLFVDLDGFQGKWPKYVKVLTGYGNYKVMPVIS